MIESELPEEQGVEVYGSIVDRHSIKDMRLGLDVSDSFAVGDGTVPAQRRVRGARVGGTRLSRRPG